MCNQCPFCLRPQREISQITILWMRKFQVAGLTISILIGDFVSTVVSALNMILPRISRLTNTKQDFPKGEVGGVRGGADAEPSFLGFVSNVSVVVGRLYYQNEALILRFYLAFYLRIRFGIILGIEY